MKTLKDYSIPIGSIDTLKNPETVICKSKTLRQSGFEDILQYQKELGECADTEITDKDAIKMHRYSAKIEYIKEKFNITEDDILDDSKKLDGNPVIKNKHNWIKMYPDNPDSKLLICSKCNLGKGFCKDPDGECTG